MELDLISARTCMSMTCIRSSSSRSSAFSAARSTGGLGATRAERVDWSW